MTDKKQAVEITDHRLIGCIWRLYGISIVLDALKSIEEKYGKLPGFGLAVAVADRAQANERIDLAGLALRQAAKSGHDVSRVNVFTDIHANKPRIMVEPIDLVEMAETEANNG